MNSKLIKLQLASLTILRYPGLSSPNLEQSSPSVLNTGKKIHLSFLLISTLIFKQPPPPPPPRKNRNFPLHWSHPRESNGTLFFLESTQCKTIITVRTIKSINQPSPFIKVTVKNKLLHLDARRLNYIRVFIYSLYIPYLHIDRFHTRGR